VENQQSEKLRCIAVAINHRIEEAAEAGYLVAGASHASVDQIEEAGTDDDQSGVAEHSRLVISVGIAKQKCRDGIYYQAEEGQYVRVDPGQGEPADDGVEQDAAGASESARPCFRI